MVGQARILQHFADAFDLDLTVMLDKLLLLVDRYDSFGRHAVELPNPIALRQPGDQRSAALIELDCASLATVAPSAQNELVVLGRPASGVGRQVVAGERESKLCQQFAAVLA